MPDTRVIYSQTTVPEPRVIMEPKTVTVQVPKTVMEPVEYTVQEPRTVMDEKSITVPKIVLEDQEITVPVPRAVQVPVQRMVPRTVMVPITTYVTQYVQETEKVRSLCYTVFQILFLGTYAHTYFLFMLCTCLMYVVLSSTGKLLYSSTWRSGTCNLSFLYALLRY